MREKKTSRPWEEGNGSKANMFAHVRIILASPQLRNKMHNAILHGSVLGAVLAVFGGICYIDTNMVAGAVISVLGLAWLWVFYFVNAEDSIFGG